jgi:peptidoglycan/xylan/chitin deacetylase (PgdA/CDA1 family)
MLKYLPCLTLLLLLGATQAIADINVFIYHRFDEPRYPSTNISIEVFTSQLEYLKTEGYQVLPLSRIAQMVREGETLPDKAVGLCVDDAFESFARRALPLLQKYGFPATLFVNTDAVGTADYLDWTQLRDVMSKGVEIGNHTASHAYYVEMEEGESRAEWQKRISADIESSKAALKKHLGVEPEIFAYTYGEYSPAVIELIKGAGFKAAFAQQSGVVYSGSDIWTLPRFPMGGPYATMSGFLSKLKMTALATVTGEVVDPVIRELNPPQLRLVLRDEGMARGAINCFVQGGNSCRVERDPDNKGEILILAEKPLTGRRNKYTLTAQGRDGRWNWFSQLWINAKRPVPTGNSQP